MAVYRRRITENYEDILKALNKEVEMGRDNL